MENKKIDFSKMTEAQANTKAAAVNTGLEWSVEEHEFLKNYMFTESIENLALYLGRTAYSIETVFSKNPEFLELRRAHGDTPEMKTRLKKVEEKQYFVSTDADVLFGTGD